MEGDLSLSQSLGGLRIANPDGAASPPPHKTSSPPPNKSQAASGPIGGQSHSATDRIPPLNSSLLDFDPSTYSVENVTLPTPQPAQNIPIASSSPPEVRHQPAPGQPTQYAHHQAVSPPSERPRQVQPASGPSGNYAAAHMPPRDDSYRAQMSNPQADMAGGARKPGPRTAAAAAAIAMGQGVPSRENQHTDRAYREGPPTQPNGGLPPRKSSRNAKQGPAGPGGPSRGMEGPLPRTNEEWKDRGAASGMRQDVDANGRPVHRYVKKGVTDFHFSRTLGEGSYSTVMLGTDRSTGKEYAIKILDKRHIIKEKKVKYVNIEKDTLNRLTEHPGIVRLYYTFQDQASLYFVLDLATGGELLGVLKKMGTFDEECTRFYGAQILDTVDYMHSKGVIHRDLKPENVLLDSRMNIKITDFGTAKIMEAPKQSKSANVVPVPGETSDGDRAVSFVGTAEYVSPELLTEKNAGKASDLWAFGCIIYQLLAGRPPFKAANEYLTFQKIVALEYTFPTGFPPVARDLVERLLVLDPAMRITIDHVKSHEFFTGIKWGRGLWQQKPPRLKAYQGPAAAPIKLNGTTESQENSYPPDIAPAHSTKPVHIGGASGTPHTTPSSQPRPAAPRLITEIPPPSQLDIEWSPVLTRTNERIIKFSNQMVLCSHATASPTAKNNAQEGGKFSRLFGGGGAAKKRQRLVMVTSTGRVLICGDEKKTKFEIPLMDESTTWKKLQDPKGLSFWTIDTRDKQFTFEDPKASSSDSSTTSASADDWLEQLEKAREMAISQAATAQDPADDSWRDLRPSAASSSANTIDRGTERLTAESASSSRHTLQKYPSSTNAEEVRGFKRFSRRQSKSGLAAVF